MIHNRRKIWHCNSPFKNYIPINLTDILIEYMLHAILVKTAVNIHTCIIAVLEAVMRVGKAKAEL